MSNQLSANWSLVTQANEVIWKLLISPGGILTGEERNIESKTATIFAIELQSGRVLWRHKALDEPWWFTSEKATESVLLLQTFRTPNMPEPKGIIALDIRTGALLWNEADEVFLFCRLAGCYVSRLKHGIRSHAIRDLHTGAELEDLGSDTDRIRSIMLAEQEIDIHSRFAEPLPEESPHFQVITRILETTLKISELRGPIEFLEFGDRVILTFHHRITDDPAAALENLLANELVVIDRTTGTLLFRETLHRRTPLPLPDNFFVSHHTLLYVKEKQTLTGVRLD